MYLFLGLNQFMPFVFYNYAAAAKSLQSCLTLCDPIDSSPPGSSIHGILQARILEWVAISFSIYSVTQIVSGMRSRSVCWVKDWFKAKGRNSKFLDRQKAY